MSYRDLPPGRERRLSYSREIELDNLRNLQVVSSHFQRLSIQPSSSLVRRNALRRRAAFFVSRPNIVNGELVVNGEPAEDSYSDMPPLEVVPESSWGLPESSWGLPNEEWHVEIVNLVNEKLIEKSSVSINYFNDNFCVICQDNIQIAPKQKCIMRVLECTHAFHIDCVDKWFTTNKTCPTCKYTF